MLVLSRREEESILIRCPNGGPDIEVKVLQIARNSIRIGFDAPKEYVVVRTELLDRPRS